MKNSSSPSSKKIKVALRFDDYSTSSNTEIELRILQAFADIDAPVTFAVIPFEAAGYTDGTVHNHTPLCEEKALILKRAVEANLLEVALHGYTHGSVRIGDPAEFIGYGVEHQRVRLVEGKLLLENITGFPVVTFVPPWNQYDDDTLSALESAKFMLLSARADAPAHGNSTLAFLPATTGVRHARKAIEAARSEPGDNIVIILLHEYDFSEIDSIRGCINFDEFLQLLTWIKRQADVEILSLKQIHKQGTNLSLARYQSNRRSGIMARLLPEKWVAHYRGFYHDGNKVYKKIFSKIGIFYGAIASLAVLLSFVFSNALLPVSKLLVQIGALTSVFVAAGITYRAFRSMDPFMRGTSLSAFAVGACLGCISTLLIS